MIKLTVRTNGSGAPQWWHNFVEAHNTENMLQFLPVDGKMKFLRTILSKQNISLCAANITMYDVWLEFETEQDKNWFILKWS